MNNDIATSVAKSTTSLFGQQLVTWGSSFVLMLFLPRYLGPVDYGRLYLAEMIAGLFLIVIDYDGRYGIAKRVSRNKGETATILSNSLGFRVLLWAAAFLVMVTFAFSVSYPLPVKIMVFIMGVEMLWLGAKTVLTGAFLGHEVLQYASVGAIAERVFIAALGVVALLLGANAIHIAIIMICGTFINFLFCVKYTRRENPGGFPPVDWKASATLLREGVPYLLWTIFGVIYYRIDTVMLSFYTPEQVVGWYAASYRFFDVLAFLPSIFSLAILPILSKLWGKEDSMLARTTQKSQEFILMAGIPMSIGVYAFSKDIIGFLFGLQGYAPSVLNLQIFAIGLTLIYLDMVLATAIIACDKQRRWVWTAGTAVVVNVVLNFLLIPYTQAHYGNGGIGAALATLVTEFYVMVSAVLILPKELFSPSSVPVSLKSIAAGALMGGVIWLLKAAAVLPFVAEAVIAGLFYVAVLAAMKTFSPSEIAFAKHFFTARNLRAAFVPRKEGPK
jgi:O-antigen/teichoic acid export membrane protein